MISIACNVKIERNPRSFDFVGKFLISQKVSLDKIFPKHLHQKHKKWTKDIM